MVEKERHEDPAALEAFLTSSAEEAPELWRQLLKFHSDGDDHEAFVRTALKVSRFLPYDNGLNALALARAIDMGLFDFAGKIAEKLSRKQQKTPEFGLQLARLAYSTGDPEKCLRIVSQHIEPGNASPHAYGMALIALSALTRFDDAFEMLTDQNVGGPEIDWAIHKVLDELARGGHVHSQRDAAIEAVALARGDLYLETKTRLQLKAMDYQGATASLSKLLSVKPVSDEGLFLKANLGLLSGSWHEYREVFKQAIANPALDTALCTSIKNAQNALSALDAFYESPGIASQTDIQPDYKIPEAVLECCYLGGIKTMNAPESPQIDVGLVGATMAGGGAERVLLNAQIGFTQHTDVKSELWLYSADPAQHHNHYLREYGIDIETASDCRVLPGVDTLITPFSWLHADLSHNSQRVYSEILRRRPKVVHAWQDSTNLEVAVAGIAAGVERIVLHPHNLQPDLVHKIPIAPAFRRAYKALLQRPDIELVCCSKASLNDYMRWLEMQPNEHCHVVYNGLNWPAETTVGQRATEKANLRAAFGISPNAQVIGGVFRVVEIKRPELWLDVVLTMLRQDDLCHALLFGDGPKLHDLEEMAEQAGLRDRITFAGNVTNASEKIIAFDVLLHTSSTEALPTVILEALVGQVPVVAANVGGTGECLPTHDGRVLRLVDSARSDAFVAQISNLFDLPLCAQLLRDAATTVRRQFGVEKMVRDLQNIYEA